MRQSNCVKPQDLYANLILDTGASENIHQPFLAGLKKLIEYVNPTTSETPASIYIHTQIIPLAGQLQEYIYGSTPPRQNVPG